MAGLPTFLTTNMHSKVTTSFKHKVLKSIIIALYCAIILTMGTATFIEKQQGSNYAASHIYGSWWFCMMWALLTATGAIWLFMRMRAQSNRRWPVVILHIAFIIILTGALTTHLSSSSGVVYLREGETANQYMETENKMMRTLPFHVSLNHFEITYHEGTTSAADYISHLAITTNTDTTDVDVSMNSIYSKNGVRLYQSGFDEDGHGSYLSVTIDPWGVPITYIGYALLFISFAWMLLDSKGTFRRLLRSPEFNRPGALVVLMLSCCTFSSAAPTLTSKEAELFGKLNVLYNGRICPMQTYALDFTKKLCGKRHYGEYDAEQVLAGFIFHSEEWNKEPIIKIKSGPLKKRLGLPDHASFATFFNSEGYVLGPLLMEYYQGNLDALHKEVVDYDDKLQLIVELRQGVPLKMFPYKSGERLSWYSPTDSLPPDMEDSRKQYIRSIFSIIGMEEGLGNHERVSEGMMKLQKYQQTFGKDSLPSETCRKAEHIYNAIPFATILFILNLTMAIVSIFLRRTAVVVMLLSLTGLTTCIVLRWMISGTIPMSNGYETMLMMAWFAEVMSLVMSRRFPIMTTFGFLMSGLFLLVSHIGQMNPQITHLMPVLNSPLLSIHVSIIMLAYALLGMTFACGVTALVNRKKSAYLQALSLIFLYPSLAALSMGIFTGAIWANVSWGSYWSWDPKEVWALITLMTYAVAAHRQSLPFLRRPIAYHVYMVLSFLTLLMTYFGVNYFLGGMHSYA